MTFTKPASAPGFKLGDGPQGGYSTFGKDGKEGLVIHRFHPLVKSTGSLIIDGAVVDATGEAMFVHAIQGMRPDSVASRWNFAFFTTGGGNPEDEKLGHVRAVLMEFETTVGFLYIQRHRLTPTRMVTVPRVPSRVAQRLVSVQSTHQSRLHPSRSSGRLSAPRGLKLTLLLQLTNVPQRTLEVPRTRTRATTHLLDSLSLGRGQRTV